MEKRNPTLEEIFRSKYKGAELEEALRTLKPIDFSKYFKNVRLKQKPAAKPPSIFKVMFDLDDEYV